MIFRENVLSKNKGPVIISGLFCIWLLCVSSFVCSAEQSMQKTLNEFNRPNLLLLKNYDASLDVQGWLMSEKLDGVRAYWNGEHLMSRQGNLFAVPKWFVESFPPFALDGELWLDRGVFEETVSIVRRQAPHDGWRQITYHVFEVPEQLGGLIDRLDVLRDYLKRFPAPYIRIIQQTPVSSNEEIKSYLRQVVALGGEGLVLRNPEVRYQQGRSDTALKMKLKEDAECIVRGYTKGKGKYRGKVGALVCELMPGQFDKLISAKNRTIKLGSGLSDVQRAKPPAIGSVVTFRFSGLTKKGLPRFAVFWRVRADWKE